MRRDDCHGSPVMFNRWNTCRFCDAPMSDELVKYGARHYAHYDCYLDAGKKLSDLPRWQVEKFPYFLLRDRGLLEEAEQIIGSPMLKRGDRVVYAASDGPDAGMWGRVISADREFFIVKWSDGEEIDYRQDSSSTIRVIYADYAQHTALKE